MISSLFIPSETDSRIFKAGLDLVHVELIGSLDGCGLLLVHLM